MNAKQVYGFNVYDLEPEIIASAVKSAKVYSAKLLVETFSTKTIMSFCRQVSFEIDVFLLEKPGGMLPKTAEDIYTLILAGESFMTIGNYQGHLFCIAHGANYELLNKEQGRRIGFQVVEHGSGMVAKPFRNHGAMRAITKARVDHCNELYGEGRWVGIFTAKMRNTVRSWYGALDGEIDIVDWYGTPYLSALTDVCSGVEPRQYHTQMCPLRVAFAKSKSWTLDRVLKTNGIEIPCTLVTSTPQAIQTFEARMRQLHFAMLAASRVTGAIVNPNTEEALNGHSFAIIDDVYESLKSYN